MRQWEYTNLTVKGERDGTPGNIGSKLVDELGRMGKEGWEMVGVTVSPTWRCPQGETVWWFKRPVPGTEVYR